MSDKGIYKLDGELLGPTGNRAFFSATDDSRYSVTRLGDEYYISETNYSSPIKLYTDQSDTIRMRTAGLPQIPSEPTPVPSVDDEKSYLYAIIYVYEYTIGTTLFRDESAPRYFSVSDAPDFSSGTGKQIELFNLPILSNGITGNYDELNVKVEIYRTTSDSGNTFYLLDFVSNGTTTYIDNNADSDIITNPTLYINSGSVANDPPPRCKYLIESNKAIWYLNIQENGEIRSNRLRQSIQYDGDSCPADFFTDLDAAITGGSSANDRPVIFTEDKTYRIDGVLSESGAGSIIPENISETVGCINHDSIVKSNERIYFASKDGFYATNGYEVKKLSDKIDETYKELQENPKNFQGAYDRFNKRVYWTVRSSTEDNDTIIIYEERFGAFTVMKGETFFPTAITFDDDLIRADKFGYLYKHNKDLLNDRLYDENKAPADWINVPIIYSWKSIAWDLGAFDTFKYITKYSISGKPETNIDFTVRSFNEGEESFKESTPANFKPEVVWGDETITWGDVNILWNKIIFLNKTRRFPRGGLRAKHRQIEITNAYVDVKTSVESPDSYMRINSSAKTASLVSPSDYVLGLNYENYFLELSTGTYRILDGSTSTLVLEDLNGTLVDGDYPYEIKGFIKGQRPHIHSVVIYYTLLDNDGGFPT